MDCTRAAELLPWYLNGTLEAAEGAELEEHLAACESCRAELAEAETAHVLFGGHPGAEMLVDYAFDRPAAPRDVIEAHLAGCEACAEELAMVRESRAELVRENVPEPAAGTKVVPLRRPAAPAPWRRAAAVAAAIVGLIGASAGLWSWRALDRQQIAAAERERVAERRIAELEAELRGIERVRLNVPIHDLWPEGARLRSVDAGPIRLPLTDGPPATVILNSLLDSNQAAERLELRDAEGRVLESLAGLEPDPTGAVRLSLPLGRLGRGSFRILLYAGAGDGPIETYDFELY